MEVKLKIYHDAHVVAKKPKCTCCNAGNKKVERYTRRAHMGRVSRQWEDGHDCDVEGEVEIKVEGSMEDFPCWRRTDEF